MHYEKDGIYHVYNKSHRNVFVLDDYYLLFLKKVKKYISPCCEILAWCLMPNHFHFLIMATQNSVQDIEEPHRPTTQQLSKNWGTLLSSFTLTLNKKNETRGPLWFYRTTAKMLNGHSDNYPFVCFQYIHQNPVRSGLVKRMEEWKYSSYNDFAGRRNGQLVNKALAFDIMGIKEKTFLNECRKELDQDQLNQIW